MGDDTLNKKVDGLGNKVDNLGEKVNNLDQKVDTLQEDVTSLEKNVGILQKDMTEVKVTLTRHESSQDKMAHAIVKLETTVEEIKETMATKDDIRGIQHTLDAFVKLYKDTREEQTFLSYRVQENTTDIGKLKIVTGLT